jgi:hypothetical protein
MHPVKCPIKKGLVPRAFYPYVPAPDWPEIKMISLFLKLFPMLLVSALVGWRLYRRIRRHTGRQTVKPKRTILRILLFTVIGLSALLVSLPNPKTLFGFSSGILLGVPLAWYSLRLTRFETTPEGRFYTPNTYIGVGLSVLLVARVTYNVTILSTATRTSDRYPLGTFQSSITLLIFALLVSYYIAYYAGVFIRSRK